MSFQGDLTFRELKKTFLHSMLLKIALQGIICMFAWSGLVLNVVLKPLPTAKTILFCELTNQNC